MNHTPYTLKSIKSFVGNGGDVNEVDESGNTILSNIVGTRNKKTSIEFLLKHGADVNHRCRGGHSVVTLVRDIEILRLFIDYGADLHSADTRGHTCFHYDAMRGSVVHEFMVMYLAVGVDINARDHDGRTALHLSRTRRVSGSLIKYGADENALDNRGRTALHYAMRELVAKMKKECRYNNNERFIDKALDNAQCLIILGVDMNIRDVAGIRCMDEFLSILGEFAPGSGLGKKYHGLSRLADCYGLDF